MSNATIQLTPPLRDYLLSVGVNEPALLKQLRDETAQLAEARMQICPEQGAFMGWLARTLGVRHALEVGVFTGYSSLCVALAATDARITALDVSEEYTTVARRYWKQAGVDGRVDLRLGPAVKSLDNLVSEGASGQYDFAFIDADKSEYADYYERCLVLLRPGGVILFDNVLWAGHVIDPSATDDDTLAIRALNEKLRTDSRIDQVMLPVGDGVTLCRKR